MPKVTQTKIGQVFLKEVEPRKWRASWVDPLTRRHVRRILPAGDFREAERIAKEINGQLAAGRGFGGRLRGTAGHLITDAIGEAINHTDANERTRADYRFRANPFIEYLNTQCKGVVGWGDVTEHILANYIEHCRRSGIAHDTLRLRLFVLRLTSDYMNRTYPQIYRDVAGRLRLKRVDLPNAAKDEAAAILSADQLRGLLAWLKENRPMIHAWAVLQGLCGLRLLEAAYLREQDLDPRAGTVTITANGAHRPKNRHSYRQIPICAAAADTLRSWIDGLKVRHNDGFIFIPSRAPSGRKTAKWAEAKIGVLTPDRIKHLWADALDAARKDEKLDLPAKFLPRRLRGTFVTMMREAGADFADLQAFIGHAPATIMSAHYDKIDSARLAAISRLAQDLADGTGTFATGEKKALKN